MVVRRAEDREQGGGADDLAICYDVIVPTTNLTYLPCAAGKITSKFSSMLSTTKGATTMIAT